MSPILCISDFELQRKHLEKFKSNRATKNRRRKSKVNCSFQVPHPNFLRPESYSSAATARVDANVIKLIIDEQSDWNQPPFSFVLKTIEEVGLVINDEPCFNTNVVLQIWLIL